MLKTCARRSHGRDCGGHVCVHLATTCNVRMRIRDHTRVKMHAYATPM